MRLTLRTLLAYLDDLLEPSDAKDIGQRVEESEFATSIINRIHDCMRRLRLGVPALNARGTGGDANTVAEYLDNTMAPDLVPEFERVCLESDIHLAEVAASHQILTLVLGEPAEIDPASRQRMYRLLYEPEGETTALRDTPVAGATVVAPSRPTKRRPEVPEYLRDVEGSGWLPIAAVVGAALILIGAGVFLFWPTGKAQPPLAMVDPAAQENALPAAGEIGEQAAAEPADGQGDESAGEPNSFPGDEAALVADDELPTHEERNLEIDELQVESEPAEVVSNPGLFEPEVAGAETDLADAEPAEEMSEVDGDATDDNDVTPGPAQMGRFVSEGQIVLRQVAADDWMRLPPRELIMPGDALVSLPTFRGTLALTTGITVQVLGSSKVRLNETDNQGVPEIEVDFGRIVLMSSGQPGARVRLRAGAQVASLVLSEASSLAGIEVFPALEVGPEGDLDRPVLGTLLFVANGTVKWDTGDSGKPQTVVAPAIQSWAGERPPQVTPEDLPAWLVREAEFSLADRRAADAMTSTLGTDRSARLTLLELANQQKNEVKSLAVRGLALIEQYEPIVDALGDNMQRSFWDGHIELLRAARASGEETSSKLYQAVRNRKPAVADILYRMLAGYTPDQLRDGEATRLVASLDNEDLAVRVLAGANLEQFTGTRFRPQDPPNLRQPQVRRLKLWAEQYERGEGATPAPARS